MTQVFAATKEAAEAFDPDAEFVNHGVCPTCSNVVAHAMEKTVAHSVEGYTVECNHLDPATPYVRNDDGSHTNPHEGLEAETVTPVWSVAE